jgi:GTP-binding protein
MKILSAEFVTGAVQPSQFPASVLPEVAFAGKSNVGKSSLINALLGRKHLVKTSSTPGKTREINFFLVNGAYSFVDLPGYGYAEAPKQVQRGWQALLEGYLTGRAPLRGVVLIVDARHDPGPLDVAMKDFLASYGVPILAVANKVDKLSRSQVPARLAAIARQLDLAEPPVAYSSKAGEGQDALWARLNALLRAPARHIRNGSDAGLAKEAEPAAIVRSGREARP